MTSLVRPLRILIIEDSISDADLIQREFARGEVPVECERVHSAATLRAALSGSPWDVIICDFAMPGFGADGALEIVREHRLELPFLLVSGTIPDETAVRLMRAGANDYILKDNLTRLLPTIRRELKEAEGRRHRQEAEEALRDSEERLRACIETSPNVAMQWFDDAGRVLYWNPASAHLFGWTSEEALGRTIDALGVATAQAADLLRMLGQIKGTGRTIDPVELTVRRKNGQSAAVLCTLFQIPSRDRTAGACFAAISVDITERKQAELEREESRALYHSLVAHLPAAVFRKDLDGRFQFVNAKFCEVRKRRPEDILGRTDQEISTSESVHRYRDGDRRVMQTGEILRSEEVVAGPDGSSLYYELIKAPVRDGDGRIIGVQGFFWDITERKSAEAARASLEAQLRQVQKMEAIGQLSGGIAHDFNNILTVIQGHVSLIESEAGLPADVRESLEEIAQATVRAANLTRQLLTFSRRQTLQPKRLDLNEVVANLTKMLQRIVGEDIRMHLHFCPQPALVHADASMLEQILLNLVVNARDAMPEGGGLTISTDLVDLTEVGAAAWADARPGSFVRLSVTDTGDGIAPLVLPHIFEPFFTTKDVGKGTGLGLATVYGIVQQHQGWISVDSTSAKGTTFRIHLPRVAANEAERPTSADTTPARGGEETILLVEDEPAVRSLARSILTRYGYRVLEAANGPAALGVWASHQNEIRLLITDLVMPDHMSGRKLAQELLRQNPRLRVIYITGYSAEIAGRVDELQEGFNFLRKPFSAHRLAVTVRANLDAHVLPG